MKSIYESIKGILSEGPATNPNAQGKEYTNPRMPGYYKNKMNPAATAKPATPATPATTAKPATPAAPAANSPAAKSLERGQALKNALGLGDKNKPSATTTPAPKADTSSDAAKPGTWGNPKTSNPLIAKNREMVAKQQATGVNQAPGRAGPGSYDPAPKAEVPKNAAAAEKPVRRTGAIIDTPSKPPKQASITTTKPAADNAPTSNDAPKPAATDASSLAKAQGKEPEAKAPEANAPEAKADPTDSVFTGGSKVPTAQKRSSILPSDTMAKQVASTRDTVAKAFAADKGDGEDTPKMAAKVQEPKAEEPKQASKAEKPAEDGNTKTDADGRTYVRQKGVMGQPDTWNRSYASAGDFLNKIRGKGDVNGKETTKEDYVNKTFGVSKNLVTDILEVMKKKESSTPRNDKEQDLAAHYGDPKRITHGDILVARGVVKQKKVQEGTMRNGKYVDDAPRPGTNEVPSPDEGYRGPGKPLYTPVDNKKSAKKTKMAEASDYTLDPKLKSPNSDEWNKPSNEKFKSEYHQGGNAAYDKDLRGQKKYKERTSGGLMNKIKDKLGVDKADSSYGPKEESRDTPGNSYEHQCAIHVRSESFGEGRTVTTQHADPDRDGYIAWYDVMFEHGIEKYVPTAELEILVSESHMHSKRKKTMSEDAATDKLEKLKKLGQGADKEDPAAAETPAPKTNALGVAAQANVPGADALTGGASKPAPQAATPPPAPNAVGVQAQANVKGADALTGGAPAPQAAATPKPAQSDAMSAIDGGSIGTSQSSFQTGPRDLKQGIAANAPAARVVSTSAGAKEAGVPQPNPRIAGFQSNARAREQAAGAAGVAAPMPGGGGKTIAQVRQDLGGKPVPGTPAADAAAKQNMAGNAPAARVVSKQDQAYPQGDRTVGNYDYKNKQAAANPSGSGAAPTPQASSTPAPGAPKINPKSNIAATIERKKQEFMDQAKAAGIPDKAEFTAGQKPGETRSASYSVDTKGGVPQASSTQPAGESPEEKARKAAAQKKPAGSFQGQGMVGTDW